VELSEDRDYAHKSEPDGSLESICLFCFRTVAAGRSLEVVERSEAQHTCPFKTKGEGNPFKLQRDDGR
jgi:hypothetical protein